MKRLMIAAVLLLPSAAFAQHPCRGVSLPDTIRLTDAVLGPTTPVTLTWNGPLNRWIGNGNGCEYQLAIGDDNEIGEDYCISLFFPDSANRLYAWQRSYVRVISTPGVLPLVFEKKEAYWPLSLFFLGIGGPPVPFPPSIITIGP